MNPKDIKSKVLEDLIQKMDERMIGDLKSKSPKFMKVETNDPEMAKDVVKNAVEGEIEDQNEDPSKEMSMKDMMEDKSEVEGQEPQSDEDPDPNKSEDLERLYELYRNLK